MSDRTIASATLNLTFTSKRQGNAISKALLPEVNHPLGHGAHAILEMKGNHMLLKIRGRDTAKLRAIVTSYLRLITASLMVLRSVTDAASAE